jgi:hypothetical protein
MISIFGSKRINYSRLSTSRPCSEDFRCIVNSISMMGCVFFFLVFLFGGWGGGGGRFRQFEQGGQAFLTQLDLSSVIGFGFSRGVSSIRTRGLGFLTQLDLSSVMGFGFSRCVLIYSPRRTMTMGQVVRLPRPLFSFILLDST